MAEQTQATLQALVEETAKDHRQVQAELKEIDLLIQQSASEVERLAQRNAQLANHLRQLQANFETVPREDIREAYEAIQATQQRLYTMRGQLEKLQSDQRNLERLAEFQRKLLRNTEDYVALPGATRSRKGDQSDVVRVIQAQEVERQSLVRRMHDGPASSLSNFILQAEICQRFFDTDPERARAELNVLKSAATTTFNTIKSFIFDLRPMMLDDLGVVPTLRRYVESFHDQTGIPASITVTGAERRLASHLEVMIFRVVQELMNNAAKHAQPTQITVHVDVGEERATAVVEDNGSGFMVDDAFASTSRSTIGLSSIRDRLEMLGGELTIQSSLGQGTRAEFYVPITEAREPELV
jgi:two-component system sensor histidine kinase DegS